MIQSSTNQNEISLRTKPKFNPKPDQICKCCESGQLHYRETQLSLFISSKNYCDIGHKSTPLIRFRRLFPRIIFLWTRQTKEPITPVFFQQLQLRFPLQLYTYVGGWNKVCIHILNIEDNVWKEIALCRMEPMKLRVTVSKSELLCEFSFNITFLFKHKRTFPFCFSKKLNMPGKIFLDTGHTR